MGTVYLIPTFLHSSGMDALPAYLLSAIKNCQVIFAENERSTRRFLKLLSRDINIEDFEWFTIHKAEEEQLQAFTNCLKENKNVAIISEAGCPAIADPGQILVARAQSLGVTVKPYVGPASMLLALMASGLNGQQFCFAGYLPIDNAARFAALRSLEADSRKNGSTQIFIETPYRNMQLLQSVLQTCQPATKLCIAYNLTAPEESIVTKEVQHWKNSLPEINKIPAIFLLHAG